MATSTSKVFPDDQAVLNQPYQPLNFDFPKRPFGKKAELSCFRPSRFYQWPFLHYHEADDVVFCHLCVKALTLKPIKSKPDPAFVSTLAHTEVGCWSIIVFIGKVTRGFSNWKDATTGFKNHVKSACHREAVEVLVTLSATTRDVGEHVSHEHAVQKVNNQQALLQVLSSVRFLGRQGLAFRGDEDKSDGNLQQLLFLQSEKDPNLAHWLKRKKNVYTSPQIQNEIIKTLGLQVLRNIARDIHNSPSVTVMADETTDASNREQFTVIIRRVLEDLQMDEEFIGLYQTSTTDAATLAALIKDVFLRLNVSMKKLRGQCFDGASAMSGYKTGVAKRINDIEPRAVFTHCYGHALNLAANDTLKQSKLMKDVLDKSREITKLIKYSPRREGIFMKLKESLPASSTGIRVLCPTRWTVRADTLSSIISNYEALQNTWEEALAITKDTEAKARVQGVSSQMDMFQFLYGIMLSEMILTRGQSE
ncbi:zinc finger MYM-type protein 1-like [Corticium candelabrum]|uniref:zinc finger MYM-type protein 1-like n=1 Tax=Corticium candelabrum TaxID=121492 RepID=UPI002E25E2DD|nr:zinc finger MYM-type protein 1-like [Corticium candelabrum]